MLHWTESRGKKKRKNDEVYEDVSTVLQGAKKNSFVLDENGRF
jgi:hypothetical protein